MLNGEWLLWHSDPQSRKGPKPYLPSYVPTDTVPAQVPGMVQLDMLAAGKIPDPFYGINTDAIRWMENQDWWYRKDFTYRPAAGTMKTELLFRGLDTFATLWLNGKKIGSHDNFFIAKKIDVTGVIRPGKNTVVVKLGSIWTFANQKDLIRYGDVALTEQILIRKPAMSFGWDIAPRIVTAGIWRPVEIVESAALNVEDVGVVAKKINSRDFQAKLTIRLRNNTARSWKGELAIRVSCGRNPIVQNVRAVLKPGASTLNVSLRISDAKLWWPRGYGHQNLYRLTIGQAQAGTRTPPLHASRFGCRDLRLIQEPQENGKAHSFIFEVNGTRIYIKGTNWIPLDAIFARVDRKRYDHVLTLACNQGNNMLRIWGGGIYEDPYFYDRCDELGILIWQDFMFACAPYPEDAWFLRQVRKEADSIVKELRNHPCLALWCGDNEIERAWHAQSLARNSPATEYRNYRINRTLLPTICRKLDPDRPFLTSSPTSPFGATDPDDPCEGDHHLWHYSHHYRCPAYSQDKCRFVSEIGFVALPWQETLRKVLPEKSLWPMDMAMVRHHNGIACAPTIEDRPHLVAWTREAAAFSALIFPVQYQVNAPFKVGGGWLKISRFPSGRTSLYRLEVPDPLLSVSPVTHSDPAAEHEFAQAVKEGRGACWSLPDSDKPLRCNLQVERLRATGERWHQQLFNVAVDPKNSLDSVRLAWSGDPSRIPSMESGVAHQGLPIGSAKNLDQYILCSQMAQAIALQAWMEHYRCRKWLCGGSLYWNLFDNWPQIADAAVDYYGVPKISYYSIKRSYADVLVSFQENDGTLSVITVNDTMKPVRGKLHMRLETWKGKTIWQQDADIDIPANSGAVSVCCIDPAKLPAHDQANTYLRAQLFAMDDELAVNYHFWGEPALANPPSCRLSCRTVAKDKRSMTLEIKTNSFARFVHLKMPDMENYLFSDNWFHLPPGSTKNVEIRRIAGQGPFPEVAVSALANIVTNKH